jgi:hypothetical protein
MNQGDNNNDTNLPLLVGVLVFYEVELLDLAGPFEVLSVTRVLCDIPLLIYTYQPRSFADLTAASSNACFGSLRLVQTCLPDSVM